MDLLVVVGTFRLEKQPLRMAAYERFMRAALNHARIAVVNGGSNTTIFLKENLQNLGWRRTQADAYAFLDPDIVFLRQDWVKATCEALERSPVVKMFSQALYLDANGQVDDIHLNSQHAMVSDSLFGELTAANPHTGLAWAWRRETLEAVGGLFDLNITGAGDVHMDAALRGHVVTSRPPNAHPDFIAALDDWQEKVTRHVAGNVGCVPGAIAHLWHGPKSDRGYERRWRPLIDHQFKPSDLEISKEGVYSLRDPDSPLAHALKAHFE